MIEAGLHFLDIGGLLFFRVAGKGEENFMDILMNLELLPNLFVGYFVVVFELLYLLGALEGRFQLPGGGEVGLLLPLHKV